MKVVILAGGMGTRLMEETQLRPKPMVEIGGKPILWHIMKFYMHHGYNDFIICLGYRGSMIVDYFLNYKMYNTHLNINTKTNKINFLNEADEEFNVTLVNTGLKTNTAGRIKKIKKYVEGKRFMMTYGDGLSDVNLHSLIQYHEKKRSTVTLTSVVPKNTFGIVDTDKSGLVRNFNEKIDLNIRINAGFFVLEPEIFEYLDDDCDDIQWENQPLKKIAEDRKLYSFEHNGFWRCMDALRDKVELEKLWEKNSPWKVW